MKKILFLIAITTLVMGQLMAQGTIKYKGHRNYSFTERSDLRLYINGRYSGLQSKQVGAFIIPTQGEKGLVYEGNFYVTQDTVKNQRQVTEEINNAIPSAFVIDGDGFLTMVEDHGYPSFRSFPAYSIHNLKKGDVWKAQATRAVDPLSKGVVTKMPIYVQYQYTGDDYFNGEPVYLITAQWATRYGMNSATHYIDWGGDKELLRAEGSHKATLIVSKKTGAALVIRDNVDEMFEYVNGNTYQFKGTISLFTEYPPAVDRSKLLDAIKRIVKLDDDEISELEKPVSELEEIKGAALAEKNAAEKQENQAGWEQISADEKGIRDAKIAGMDNGGWESFTDDLKDGSDLKTGSRGNVAAGEKGSGTQKKVRDKINEQQDKKAEENKADKNAERSISVDNTDAGIRLTMQNLQFKADSAELLPGEEKRLSQIAEILKVAEGCKFLIEGHTASTGNEFGEMKLSRERAEAVAKALSARGISSDRFICKGSGGKKPVAPNTTPEGKARNRRVEITILE